MVLHHCRWRTHILREFSSTSTVFSARKGPSTTTACTSQAADAARWAIDPSLAGGSAGSSVATSAAFAAAKPTDPRVSPIATAHAATLACSTFTPALSSRDNAVAALSPRSSRRL